MTEFRQEFVIKRRWQDDQQTQLDESKQMAMAEEERLRRLQPQQKWSLKNLMSRIQPQQAQQYYPQQQRSPTKAIARLTHLKNLEAQERLFQQQQAQQQAQRQPFRGSLWTNQQHQPEQNTQLSLMGGQQPQGYPQQRNPNQISLMQGQIPVHQLKWWVT